MLMALIVLFRYFENLCLFEVIRIFTPLEETKYYRIDVLKCVHYVNLNTVGSATVSGDL